MKKIIFLIIIIMNIGCQKSSNIIGHWHIESEKNDNNEYMTLDVLNDSLAIIDKYSFSKNLHGIHNKKGKLLIFPGECGSGKFKYDIDNGQIFLEGIAFGDKLKGFKCQSECCNKISDITKNYKLNIELPELERNKNNLSTLSNVSGKIEEIIIGKAKSKYAKIYGDSLLLEIQGKFGEIRDIKLWIGNTKKKYSSSNFHLLNFIIVSDKSVELNIIETIRDKLKENGVNRIWLALLKEDLKNEEKFISFLNINEINSEKNLKLKDFIN